jgi:hypothetical protein
LKFPFSWSFLYVSKKTFDIPLKKTEIWDFAHSFYTILHLFICTKRINTILFFEKGMEINRLPTKKQLLTTNFWQMISNCRNEKIDR